MNLTPEQFVNIIKECKGLVTSLKINKSDIEVIFIEPQQPIKVTPLTHNQGQDIAPEIPISEENNLIKDLYFGKTQEEEDEDMLIDELHLKDPAKFEDLVVMKEVVSAAEEKNY